MKKVKKSLLVCIAALSMSGLSGCDFFTKPLDFSENTTPQKEEQQEQPQNQIVHVEDLTIDHDELDLLIDGEATIVPTVTPENATNKAVTFKSSKKTIATVSEAGVVKGVGEGTCIITVQSVDNQAKFKTCVVSVKKSVIRVADVIIGESTITITPGSDTQLAASVSPEDATNKTLIWSSNNEDKVTVDQEGHIHAVALGEASITVQSEDNPTKFKTFTVKVENTVTQVTGIELDRAVLAFDETADPVDLVATVAPADASNKAVFWTSSNQSVATVSQNGKVTPIKMGTTNVTVRTMDGGFEQTCAVTVTRVDVESFTLNENMLTFSSDATGENAKAKLIATILPATASYKEVLWSTQDPSVATVDDDGLVTMQGVGTTVITALHVNSRSTASCVVSVVEPIGLEPVLPILTCDSYQAYLLHTKPNAANTLAEFNDRTQLYEVGDDNKINLRPSFKLEDANDTVIDQNAWTFPFDIKVYDKGTDNLADSAYYNVINATTCDIQFSLKANEEFKELTVKIKLGGLSAEQYAEFESQNLTYQITAEYDIKVVDGYNVTKEVELGYLDTSIKEERVRWYGHVVNGVREPEKWDFYNFPEYKEANGLRTNYFPKSLILHKDMFITKDNIPTDLVYSAADAITAEWDAKERGLAVGSLRDDFYLFGKYDAGQSGISGNYFTLDWSAIPLVKRTSGYTSYTVKPESKTGFMRLHNGSFEIKNINFIGNAHTASFSTDKAWAGGLIGFKVRDGSSKFEVKNVLGHGCYTTFMNEGYYQIFGGDSGFVNAKPTEFIVKDSKFFDNYNAFLYNWGGETVAENVQFEGCGGPIIIQDHVISQAEHDADPPEVTDPYASANQYFSFQLKPSTYQYKYDVVGAVANTKFIDCSFHNYVLGTESWFASFGADALTGQIKQMLDLLPLNAGKHSAVFNSQYQPSTYNELNDMAHVGTEEWNPQPSLFNFIVINKSGRMASMSNNQVCGEVSFWHRKDNGELEDTAIDDFKYRAPSISKTDSTPGAEIQQAAEYLKFRGVGFAGAPIFETAGGCGFYNPDLGELDPVKYAMKLIDINEAGKDPEQEDLAVVSPNIDNAAHEYISLYYQGMMLVMKLGSFGA